MSRKPKPGYCVHILGIERRDGRLWLRKLSIPLSPLCYPATYVFAVFDKYLYKCLNNFIVGRIWMPMNFWLNSALLARIYIPSKISVVIE